MQPLPDEVVIEGIVQTLIPPAARKAIVAAAERGCGAARDLPGILTTAREHRARPRVVAAAFAFLPVLGDPHTYVDLLDVGPDAIDTADLPSDPAAVAALALARAVIGDADLCPIAFPMPK